MERQVEGQNNIGPPPPNVLPQVYVMLIILDLVDVLYLHWTQA
jgi:hypothetical protein